jgi:hypothetical protein
MSETRSHEDPPPDDPGDTGDVDEVERGEKPDPGSMDEEVDRAQEREDRAAEG